VPETPLECQGIDADLSALIDAELDAGRASEVRAHVAGCERCAARLEALERVDRRLAETLSPPVPADLAERVAARLAADAAPVSRPRTAPPPRVHRGLRAAAALAAAAAVGLVVWFGLPEDPTRPGPQIARAPETPEPLVPEPRLAGDSVASVPLPADDPVASLPLPVADPVASLPLPVADPVVPEPLEDSGPALAAAPTPEIAEEELDAAALLLAMDELADPDDLGLVANLELVELLVDLGLPEGA